MVPMSSPPLEIVNVDHTTVEPLEKTVHVDTINTTDHDIMQVDIYAPRLFAYRLENNSDALYRQMVDRIKDGLRKVFVPFFPWAGRWIAIQPEGRGRQLLCNDKGIPFIEAYVEKDLDSVVGFSVDFKPVIELQGWSSFGLDGMALRQRMLPDGLPCAFIQVTRFKCGGLVLAFTLSHQLSDGKSCFDFLTAWSGLSRTNRTDMILDHDRVAIQTCTRPIPSSNFPGYVPYSTPWEVKGYEVTASVIDSLKTEFEKISDGTYVSTVDCVTGQMWKILSSLPFSILGGKEIAMVTVVEGRTKFYDPPAPNLLGNVVMRLVSPKISTAKLLQMSVSSIGSAIRDKINTTSRETWLSPERMLEARDAFNDKTLVWLLNSWKSFPVYKLDFGFGNPLFASSLNDEKPTEGCHGRYVVMPPTPGVSISAACVQITSTPEVLEALEHHPDFHPFFITQNTVKALMKQ